MLSDFQECACTDGGDEDKVAVLMEVLRMRTRTLLMG